MERKRLIFVARWIVIPALLLLMGKYFWVQVVKSGHYQQEAVAQRVKSIEQEPERGKILDRNGSAMAISLIAQDIAVWPEVIAKNGTQDKVAKGLSDALGLPYNDMYAKVTALDPNDASKPAPYMPVAKRVDPEKAMKLKEMKLGGIEIKQAPKRMYLNGDFAGSVIGAVNQNNQAVAGVEVSMDSYLAGVTGYTVAETDQSGKQIPIGLASVSSPVDGQDVKLTIDSYMQYVLENRLQQTMKEMNPKEIYGVLMNPKTGEIYASAGVPSFSPAKYGEADPKTWTRNPASFVYEPGSTFKPVFMALALNRGTVDDSTRWQDPGYLTVSGSRIYDWNKIGWGTIGLRDTIVHSSNVGMMRIGQTLTSQQIAEDLARVGYGKKTGVEMPGEETGLVPSAEELDKDPLKKATVSFGQGISITPMQLITAFSQLINGGKQIQSHIVAEVRDKSGNLIYQPKDSTGEQIFKPEVSEKMKTYLQANSVEGSGANFQIPGYKMGTKTGTANFVENGRYKDGSFIGSMMGFAPYDDPQFALLIVIVDPKAKVQFGNEAAGPTFKDVMSEVLRYKAVPNDGKTQEKVVDVPDVRWMLLEDAEYALRTKSPGVAVQKEGEGDVVTDQNYKYVGGKLQVTLRMKKAVDGETVNVPDLRNKTKEQTEAAFGGEAALRFHGEGSVAEQSLAPGSYSKNKELSLWLK